MKNHVGLSPAPIPKVRLVFFIVVTYQRQKFLTLPENRHALRIPSIQRLWWWAMPTLQRCHYIIDWNYDEDRSRIHTGYGQENMTRLRRFAISIIKSRNSATQKMRQLMLNVAWS